MKSSYDKKYLLHCLAMIGLVILSMHMTGGDGFVIIVPLILFAILRGRSEDLLLYLTFVGTVVVGNSFVMPKSLVMFVTQRILLIVLSLMMAMNIFGARIPKFIKPIYIMFVYLGYMAITAISGWCPMVSYMKILLFLFCFSAYLGVVCRMAACDRGALCKIRSIFLSFAILYILGSILLLPFPAISQLSGEEYMRNLESGREMTSLFTGMTNQSQCLGAAVAAIACLLLGDMLFGLKRPDMLYIVLLLCCPILVFKTSSRTAAGTLFVAIAVELFFFFKNRGANVRWRARVMSVAILLSCIVAIYAISSPELRHSVTKFALKTDHDNVGAGDLTVENVVSSRQGLMDQSLGNFYKSPLFGNGFQVSERMVNLKVNSIKDILSAPIEKGVWVTAILEEGGIIGFGIFLSFCLFVFITAVRNRAYITAGLFLTMLIANLGEFMIFSMSYLGGFMWAMFFVGVAVDVTRLREERINSLRAVGCDLELTQGRFCS